MLESPTCDDGTAEVSVVIVSYNVAEDLRRCLHDLRRQEGLRAQTIVVDNNSQDDSATMVRAEFPEVELIALADNEGFSSAVNRGAALAAAPQILLLNPDAVLGSGMLGRLVAALGQAGEDVAAIGPRQVDERGGYQLSVGPPARIAWELLRKIAQAGIDRDLAWLRTGLDLLLRLRQDVPWVAGSCLLVWRQDFLEIGGFDTGFFLYFEDIDFCLRLRAVGRSIHYVSDLSITHRRGASAKTRPQLAERAYRDSQRRFWRLHGGARRALLVDIYLRLAGKWKDTQADD